MKHKIIVIYLLITSPRITRNHVNSRSKKHIKFAVTESWVSSHGKGSNSKYCVLTNKCWESGGALAVCAYDRRGPPREFPGRCVMYAYNCIYNGDYEITNSSLCYNNQTTTLKTVTEQTLTLPPSLMQDTLYPEYSAYHRRKGNQTPGNGTNKEEVNVVYFNKSYYHYFIKKRPNRHPGYKTPRLTGQRTLPIHWRTSVNKEFTATVEEGGEPQKFREVRYLPPYYNPEGRRQATATYKPSRTTLRRTRIITRWTGWAKHRTLVTWWKQSVFKYTQLPWWKVTSSQTLRRWEYVDRR